MLNRFSVSLGVALLAAFGFTGPAHAARSPEWGDVMVVTGAVVVVSMAVLLIAYLVKHALGLDRMAPPDPDAGGHEHH
jgi:hypothetical protein